jgi:hypothetical protein
MFDLGDVVEVPLSDGRTAIAWIVYISNYFKDCVGFMVLGLKGQHVDLQQAATGLTLKSFGPLYTNRRVLAQSGWKKVSFVPLEEHHKMLTKRIVGGDVFIGDEWIGNAEELGETRLPSMLAMGMSAVHHAIEEAFPRLAT